MRFQLAGPPHFPPRTSVGGVMRQVLYALLPGIAAHWWFFGWGILFQIALAVGFALAFEAAMLKARGRALKPFINDYSAVVTGVLFALCIPPLAPWWVAFTGMLVAIVFAKHLYGGLGYNLFNPAMAGFAAVLVAFPSDLSNWLAPRDLVDQLPGLWETAVAVATGSLPAHLSWDAVSQATPLDLIRTGRAENRLISEIRVDPMFGALGGMGWEWIINWYALGGIYLLWRQIITWHVPVAVVATAFVVSTSMWVFGPDIHMSPMEQLYTGSLVLGAFFIATDPVSGSATMRGRLVFGAGVAVVALSIRGFGGYPDGVSFAILLMNMTVPLIDRYTRPRTYGHPR